LYRKFFSPIMGKYVECYGGNCHTCRDIKPFHHATHGTLLPHPVPGYPSQNISIDFVVRIPESDAYDVICVVIDRLPKLRHLILVVRTSGWQPDSFHTRPSHPVTGFGMPKSRNPARYWTGCGVITCQIDKNGRHVRTAGPNQERTWDANRSHRGDHLASNKCTY